MPLRGNRSVLSKLFRASVAIVPLALAAIAAADSGEKVLHTFTTGGSDGGLSIAPVTGNLYGATQTGGTHGNGIVFQLSPNADGSWTETVLYSFQGGVSDGANPRAGVVFDSAGNIYGTTAWNGANGAGTVYRLKPQNDGSWKEAVLYNFTGSGPEQAGVILDSSGNLYGTTYGEGAYGFGSVFELAAQPDGSWTETTLHSFDGTEGCGPNAEVVFDTAGNLYGTTVGCGIHGAGIVFELSPDPQGKWNATTLYNFGNPPDGGFPDTALVLDSAGNLYGTTFFGGVNNFGTVFEISSSADGWKEKVLYSFDGINDSGPTEAPVTLDVAGNLYGTTGGYDSHGAGAVYKLTHTPDGWGEGLVYAFTGGLDGGYPVAGLINDQVGNLYGTTDTAGEFGVGVVFEIANASSSGTIVVTTNLSSATFTISGPQNYSGGGTYERFSNVPPGTYTITFGPVSGYTTPPPQTQTLVANGEIDFNGTYVPESDLLIVSPASLSFAYQTGSGGSVKPQNLSVSTTGSPLFFTVGVSTTPPGGIWLLAAPPQGETPGVVTVSIAPGLPPGVYSGQVTVSATGAGNSPVMVPVTLAVTAGPLTKLVFPVREDQDHCSGGSCTPYTANMSAVFDHYMKVAYEDSHWDPVNKRCTQQPTRLIPTYGKIVDFLNESASGPLYESSDGYGPCGTLYGYTNPDQSAFLSNLHYIESPYLYYDSHPGYDYPFDFGTPVYAAISGCVSYHIPAAGASASGYHVLAIIPMDTEPPGDQCQLNGIKSDTGYVVLYMHLSSYLSEYEDGTPVLCQKPPPKGSTTCPTQVPCDKCPKEGQWVSVNRLDEIGYTGNFSNGIWGSVSPHLHFEVDQNLKPSKGVQGVPLDPYGWWSPAADPYATVRGAMNMNNWLWK